jgi:phosphotransferase system, enzyme I, PtsP
MADAPGTADPGWNAPRSSAEKRRLGAVDTLRRLLSSLRDVMAGSGSAQGKLDKIVQLIAAEMGAEVCSCYVLRAGEVLELFATKGLNPEAVHNTRLRVGEGLVGDIAAHARPVALANAPSHPNFAYRPETGEDPYQSLAGVPIMRGGRVRGVLVIQHMDRRDYVEEEVEALQTIAMVVAELVAAGDLIGADEIGHGADEALLPSRLVGVSVNSGIARGYAVLHRPMPTIRQTVADDPEHELERLEEAVATMRASIDELIAVGTAAGHGEHQDVLETYRMFAADRGWMGRLREAVRSGLTAEAAVLRVQNETRARLAQAADFYLRERLHDLEDLTNRLLQHLAGKASDAATATLPDDVILIARNLGPAELLDYDRRRLRALALEEGSSSSHVAIVARALGIPVVGQVPELMARVDPLDVLIVDGDNGTVLVRPGEDVIQAFEASMQAREARERTFADLRDQPAVTRDGVRVALDLNCGLLMDLPHLDATGADGIGLYRTEINFMMRPAFPDVEQQAEHYARVLDAAGDRPVVFRTLDVGADKKLPYFALPNEDNPALGWRAIRIGLDRPAVLRRQLRGMLRAAAGRPMSVMFPMISEVAEFDAARRILDMEVERATRAGAVMPSQLRVGVMFEVPSLWFQMDALLERVDFVSVGSNDLAQYLFAIDRGNPVTAARYDPLSPALLRLLRELVVLCDARGVDMCVCGEMAGRPIDAMALVALGVRRISMAAASLGPVKAMIRSLDSRAVADYLLPFIDGVDHSLRVRLRDFARDHDYAI